MAAFVDADYEHKVALFEGFAVLYDEDVEALTVLRFIDCDIDDYVLADETLETALRLLLRVSRVRADELVSRASVSVVDVYDPDQGKVEPLLTRVLPVLREAYWCKPRRAAVADPIVTLVPVNPGDRVRLLDCIDEHGWVDIRAASYCREFAGEVTLGDNGTWHYIEIETLRTDVGSLHGIRVLVDVDIRRIDSDQRLEFVNIARILVPGFVWPGNVDVYGYSSSGDHIDIQVVWGEECAGADFVARKDAYCTYKAQVRGLDPSLVPPMDCSMTWLDEFNVAGFFEDIYMEVALTPVQVHRGLDSHLYCELDVQVVMDAAIVDEAALLRLHVALSQAIKDHVDVAKAAYVRVHITMPEVDNPAVVNFVDRVNASIGTMTTIVTMPLGGEVMWGVASRGKLARGIVSHFPIGISTTDGRLCWFDESVDS